MAERPLAGIQSTLLISRMSVARERVSESCLRKPILFQKSPRSFAGCGLLGIMRRPRSWPAVRRLTKPSPLRNEVVKSSRFSRRLRKRNLDLWVAFDEVRLPTLRDSEIAAGLFDRDSSAGNPGSFDRRIGRSVLPGLGGHRRGQRCDRQTIARQIGVKLQPKRRWPVHGFSGHTLEAVRGHLEIEMVSRTESFCWQLPVAAVAYPDLASEETVVFGQSGFLEYFDVRFLGEAHVLELKPNASFPKKRRRKVESERSH